MYFWIFGSIPFEDDLAALSWIMVDGVVFLSFLVVWPCSEIHSSCFSLYPGYAFWGFTGVNAFMKPCFISKQRGLCIPILLGTSTCSPVFDPVTCSLTYSTLLRSAWCLQCLCLLRSVCGHLFSRRNPTLAVVARCGIGQAHRKA